MTEKEILKIKEHIEIHARREPFAVYITQIMWKAVEELEHIAELEKENAELKEKYDTCLRENTGLKIHNTYVEKKLTNAKEIIKKLKALYFSPIVTKDDVKKQDEILAEAEQFISEVKK